MKIIYKDVISINNVLNRCTTNKNFPVAAMIKLLDLKEEIKKEIDKYSKVFDEIVTHYKIPQVEGTYNWANHKEEKEISKKIDELFASKIEIKSTNFLSAEDFIRIVPEGLTLDDLSFLANFLRKK